MIPRDFWLLAFMVCGVLAPGANAAAEPLPAAGAGAPIHGKGVVRSEFVFDKVPFDSCHASTIAETAGGLAAAWFAGHEEGSADVGIWIALHDGRGWSAPVEVANGVQAEGARFPCWNPVLFNAGQPGLLLFYKIGPSPSAWWGMLTRSTDGGQTWSLPERLPQGILGPVKNKPVVLKSGALLCGSSSEHDGWRVHLETTTDLGKTWRKTGPLNDGRDFAAIQPTILVHPKGKLQILCRSRQQAIVESWSDDDGQTWSPLRATILPNPNSGIDAATLRDERSLLVYNRTRRGRFPLNVAISSDGRAWQDALTLESLPGEYSYPAVIQTADGHVHVVYTWNRLRIRHVVLDPAQWNPPQ